MSLRGGVMAKEDNSNIINTPNIYLAERTYKGTLFKIRFLEGVGVVVDGGARFFISLV